METTLWEYFQVLPDPRVERTKLHRLEDILTIAICGMICNAENWVEIEAFGKAKEPFFRTFLPLPHGIPSHDTFGRVFAALSPDEFEKCMMTWVSALAGSSEGKHIAIDGKTLRRSMDRASGKAGIHLVSAWVHENSAVFGQIKVDDKSNEITAIPRLIELLQLKGATVTIDAMGCQREIAEQILSRGGDYVLAVKGNQGTLHDDLKLFMDDAITRNFKGILHDVIEQTEKGHGRIEKRKTWVTTEVDWLVRRHHWPGLKSMGAIDSFRKIDGKETVERRYFIGSISTSHAQRMAQLIRNHWKVENELHWCLDVSFNEDASRARIGNAAENLSRVRRIALMLLKQEKTSKGGVKTRRLKAGWDDRYLLTVLKN